MISIVIPVLNEAATIEDTLDSVFSLEGDYEVVVVDGGSTDGTIAIASSWREIPPCSVGSLDPTGAGRGGSPISHQKLASRHARVLSGPRGRGKQMNLGAAEARGDVLLFLHADTRLPEAALATVASAIADPRVVGGRFKVGLSNPQPVYRLIAFTINLRDRLFRGFTGDQAIFVRADVFRQLGGYWDQPLMEDLELGKWMCQAGKVVRLPLSVTTSSRRWEKDGVLRTVVLMWGLRFLHTLGSPPALLKRFYGDTR